MVRSLKSTCAVTLCVVLSSPLSFAFTSTPCIPQQQQQQRRQQDTATALSMVGVKVRKGYEPKWKKKKTLADEAGGSGTPDFKNVGLIGDVPVVFRTGNETKTTMAFVGQPIKEIASQSGQFIKYGCGKGECGTCEALCNGKWIRPCTAVIPSDLAPGAEYVIQVKEIKSKTTSSGKFYSVKSFFMGFYNNLLGMVGFVLTRRQTRKNYDERIEFEAMVAKKAKEKKEARAKARAEEQANLKP